MTAREDKYHAKCLVAFYNHGRELDERTQSKKNVKSSSFESFVHARVFAELISYINDCRCESSENATMFKLSALVTLYKTRLVDFNIVVDRVHSTHLKEQILNEIPDRTCVNQGKTVYLISHKDLESV